MKSSELSGLQDLVSALRNLGFVLLLRSCCTWPPSTWRRDGGGRR